MSEKIPDDILEAAMEALKAARPSYDSGDQYDAHWLSVARAILAERIRSLEAAKAAIHCPCERYCDFDEAEEKIDELLDAIRTPDSP